MERVNVNYSNSEGELMKIQSFQRREKEVATVERALESKDNITVNNSSTPSAS